MGDERVGFGGVNYRDMIERGRKRSRSEAIMWQIQMGFLLRGLPSYGVPGAYRAHKRCWFWGSGGFNRPRSPYGLGIGTWRMLIGWWPADLNDCHEALMPI